MQDLLLALGLHLSQLATRKLAKPKCMEHTVISECPNALHV